MSTHQLNITASPHLGSRDSTPKIMWSVVLSLVPVIGASLYYFGPSAVLVLGAATLGALLTERIFGPKGTLRDGSAMITGLLLGLTLPPGLPLWMAFVGGVFSIGIGKLVFGGLGQNVFNPALLGRAFLQAAFPVAMTTWPRQGETWMALRGDNFALPLMSPQVDGMTGATPLGLMKFDQTSTRALDLVSGATGGSLGETAGVLILLGGVYLAVRGHLNWRIPASIFITVGALATLVSTLNPGQYGNAVFMLFSGGLMLGAVYMATDMVTSPVTNRGCWIFGIGIGVLVVVIRYWGGLAEGMMYSILLMNAMVPFIDRVTQPRVFGTPKKAVSS